MNAVSTRDFTHVGLTSHVGLNATQISNKSNFTSPTILDIQLSFLIHHLIIVTFNLIKNTKNNI